MHIPSHSPVLPDGVDPIPMPGSPREAEMLLILLDMGLYPKIVPAKSEAKSENPMKGEGLLSALRGPAEAETRVLR